MKRSLARIKSLINCLLVFLITLQTIVLSSFLPSYTAAMSVPSGPYYFPGETGINQPNNHGISVGYVGEYKTVKNSLPTKIEGLSNNDENYGAIETIVTVDRLDEQGNVMNTITGKALAYANLAKEADAGYVFVDIAEAKQWIKVLNGNEAYVLNGSTIYSHDISNPVTNKVIYQAYNLADIAQACGGRGVPNGDGLTQINTDLYRKDDHYQATPRPKAFVTATTTTNVTKTTFNPNETVLIKGSGVDYSIYDNGLIPINLSLINKTTNGEYQSAPNSTTLTKNAPLTPNSTYEVSFILTDKHMRTTQNSTDTSVGTPVTGTFAVENGPQCTTPTTATLQIAGQPNKALNTGGIYTMPSGVNTINSLTFSTAGTLKVNGTSLGTGTTFTNILSAYSVAVEFTPSNAAYCPFTYTFQPSSAPETGGECDYIIHVTTFTSNGNGEINMDMPSDPMGAAKYLDYRTDTIMLESNMKGTFLLNGVELSSISGTAVTIDNLPVKGEVFTLKFISTDGTECWVKTFFIGTSGEQEVKCPVIQWGVNTVYNGDVMTNVPLNGSLMLKATFQDNNGEKQPAELYWNFKKPDGTTVKYKWSLEGDRGLGWLLYTSNTLDIPYSAGSPSKSLAFDQPGIYEISYDTPDGSPWQNSGCAPWSIKVEITPCSTLSIKAEINGVTEPMNGDGDSGSEYNLQLPSATSNQATFTIRNQSNNTSYPGNWVLRRLNDTVPIVTAIAQNPFSYTFSQGGDYVLTVSVKIGVITCQKTIFISSISCDDLSVEGYVNSKPLVRTGDGSASNPYVISIKAGRSNSLELTVKNMSKSLNGVWTLKKANVTRYTETTNHFTYSLPDSTDTYTLEIMVQIDGQTCYRFITFKTDGVPNFACGDLVLTGSVNWTPIVPTGSGTAENPYVVKLISGQSNLVKLQIEAQANPVTGEWTLKKGGTIAQTETADYFDYTIPNTSDSYTLAVRVKNNTDYCMVFITFSKEGMSCNNIYLHYWDPTNNWSYNVAPGHVASKTIKANKLDQFALTISTKPDTIQVNEGAEGIEATWEATLPNQAGDFSHLFYIRKAVMPGTYQVKATVNDSKYPVLNGCVFTFTLIIDPNGTGPDPGGGYDGGQVQIKIFDSFNRLLQSSSDGVWEREPARIEVTIDQSKIDSVFSKIDGEINRAIDSKTAEYLAKYSASEYEDVVVRASPPTWNSKTSSFTRWPSSIPLTVNGPGTNQTFSLNPKQQTQSNMYTGTVEPTVTTWQNSLQSQKYRVQVNQFNINVSYSVQFAVSYQKCEEKSAGDDPDTGEPLPPEKTCTPGSETGNISNSFTIVVRGNQTMFEVFEPNATGYLGHTTEWSEYHSRDRYADSKSNDFYAGERILTKVQLDPRHRHPYSGKYPTVASAQAWISETGQRSTPLQSLLTLQANSSTIWNGPPQMIAKLGMREKGVDTALMGDKQRGFQKGGAYAVYFKVEFGFGVQKGFAYLDKSGYRGHELLDYRAPFNIIANAWERQGIRNHTFH